MDRKTPLLLLSGLLCDDFVWQGVARSLSEDAEIIIVSFAGCSSFAEMTDRALKNAPEHFAMAGHSMGGRVALEVTRRTPARVSRLALLNTGVHPVKDSEIPGRKALLALAATEGMHAVADQWLPPMLGPDVNRDSSLYAELRAMVLRHSPSDFQGQINALLNRPNAEHLLASLEIPALIVCCDADQWSPVTQHQAMHDSIPNSRLVELTNVGHMSIVEDAEHIADELRKWLRDKVK